MGSEYEKVSYDDIRDENEDIYDTLEEHPYMADEYTVKDLVILFQIEEIGNQIDNGAPEKTDELDDLFAQLHYEYDDYGDRIDPDEAEKQNDEEREQMRPIRECAVWDEEKILLKDKDKMEVLSYLSSKGIIVDKMTFVNDNDMLINCLGIEVREIHKNAVRMFSSYLIPIGGYEDDDNKENQMGEMVDQPLQLEVDQIQEIIVDGMRYKFLT